MDEAPLRLVIGIDAGVVKGPKEGGAGGEVLEQSTEVDLELEILLAVIKVRAIDENGYAFAASDSASFLSKLQSSFQKSLQYGDSIPYRICFCYPTQPMLKHMMVGEIF